MIADRGFQIRRLHDGRIEIRYVLADGCTFDHKRYSSAEWDALVADLQPARASA